MIGSVTKSALAQLLQLHGHPHKMVHESDEVFSPLEQMCGVSSTSNCGKDSSSSMTDSSMRECVATSAAQKIQKALRSHNERKQQLSASQIQQDRSWKVQKDFLNLRQQVVRGRYGKVHEATWLGGMSAMKSMPRLEEGLGISLGSAKSVLLVRS